MGRATEDALDALHGLLAGTLADELAAARAKRDEAGKPVPVPGYLLAAAAKFLKENGIDTPQKSARMSALAGQLAALDLDEVALERAN